MKWFTMTGGLALLAFSLIAACEPKQDLDSTQSDTTATAAAPPRSAAAPADEAPPARARTQSPAAAERTAPPRTPATKPGAERIASAAPENTSPPESIPATRIRPMPPPPNTGPAGPVPDSTESVAYTASTDAKVVQMHLAATDPDTGFATNAFPPTVPDTEWHQDAWWVNDCLRCHETGVANAPAVKHKGLTELLLASKCRTCHVLIPGQEPKQPPPPPEQTEDGFAPNAFPPMIPFSQSHLAAWTMKDCMLCHETGVHGAPIVKHDGLPDLYLRVKCRTCHVQVRSHEMSPFRP